MRRENAFCRGLSPNSVVTLYGRSHPNKQSNPLLRCCNLGKKNNKSTSYKSYIFWVPKANHLEARDSSYSIVSWHKKQRYNNKKLDSHLHDNWLHVLIMCCVPECLNIVHRNKTLKTRRAFPKYLWCELCWPEQDRSTRKPQVHWQKLSMALHRCLQYWFKRKEFKHAPKYLLNLALNVSVIFSRLANYCPLSGAEIMSIYLAITAKCLSWKW